MSAAAGGHAIEARHIGKTFGSGDHATVALDDASIAVRPNEFFTLLGPSGCGKTTLLRLIAGFEHPSRGEILLDGSDITALPPFRRPINTVFQNYALFPHMSVARNVGFGLAMLGHSSEKIAARVDEMLRLVRMDAFAQRSTSQLSGGQQQRVALARALAPAPKVLLLDEPLSSLDYKLRKEMQIELKRLQHETGITFIFVTHDQEEALTMSDRIAVMASGRVLQVASPREIYEHPANRFVADFIGESNFLQGQIESVDDHYAAIMLRSGDRVPASVPPRFRPGMSVTVFVRPERSRIMPVGDGAVLRGTLRNVIYFGTDTHYHVSLADGELFVVREQNRRERDRPAGEGDEVGVAFAPESVQVLDE